MNKNTRTPDEWRAILPLDVYQVTREKGTEPPFTGKYYQNHQSGEYLCACCGEVLFHSQDKYDSGSGWPSFTTPVNESSIETHTDSSFGMVRTEINCSSCGAHLGHVFEDGPVKDVPNPTGLRFCVNSLSLNFKKKGAD